MQPRRGYTIEIWRVLPHDCTQFGEIQEAVLDFQRIEGPFHAGNPAGQGFVPLKELETPPDTLVAVCGVNGQHMRVQVGHAASYPWQCHGEADQAAGIAFQAPARRIECAHYLAADPLAHQKDTPRNYIPVSITPHVNLQLHAGGELLQPLAWPDQDWVGG